MKKTILLFATIVFAAFTVTGQVSTSKENTAVKSQAEVKDQAQEVVKNPNAPEISFDKTVHDYGTIPYNGDGKCVFEFTNTGKEPLILTNVRSSCGCTVPKWPREPILPGQSDVINVEYKTNRIGKINKTITVQSNASNPTVVLRITGQVLKQETTVAPEKASPLGEQK
jgi:hypothetical protein